MVRLKVLENYPKNFLNSELKVPEKIKKITNFDLKFREKYKQISKIFNENYNKIHQ